MAIVNSILDLVGKTPVVKLGKANNTGAEIYVKVESFNPGGSVKDRISKNMILDAEEKGIINKDTVLIEPTSGNTGVGLAMVAAAKGYRLILVMPDTMSIERRALVQAYGAELVLTEGKLGMKGAIAKANELKEEYKNAVILQQFENPANPETHRKTTALEIIEDFGKDLDVFVTGIGTGGSITGTGEVLKANNPNIKIIAVEPKASPVLSGGQPGPHRIQGIGAGFVPKVLNTNVYDEIIQIENEVAFEGARNLARTEGILVGISSGAAFQAGLEVARRPENAGKKILVFLMDTGERYLSTGIFNEPEQA
ncbi:MAG: cysteine synthase A [Fusobacteriaceae bacterium]|nr:cysteine synthase A [Fusobacteriaceae bacterium]MBP6467001.1 cysteine synthase A [Fusobacteriaceae bacterium]MBU9918131.1 cysteine synthase A [Fusobacteriaceae bacterium]